MNNSFGIVMGPSVRMRRNRKEVRLQWIGDKSIRAGIKLKYLQTAVPNIYIHRLKCDDDSPNSAYITGLFRWLTKQNNGQNIIINQLDAIHTFYNFDIDTDYLAFPIYTAFRRTIHLCELGETEQKLD